MRIPRLPAALALAAALTLLSAAPVVRAQIPVDGFQEVIPEGGAVSTRATGTLSGSLSADGTSAEYTLTYSFPDAATTRAPST